MLRDEVQRIRISNVQNDSPIPAGLGLFMPPRPQRPDWPSRRAELPVRPSYNNEEKSVSANYSVGYESQVRVVDQKLSWGDRGDALPV
jgi:hypothetical protein